MTTMTLPELSKKMQKIDFCMMCTLGSTGPISTRPMSNNGDVDYDGDTWLFSYRDTRKVKDIAADPRVTLTFSAPPSLLGKPGIFIALEGKASLIDDKEAFKAHWNDSLDRWFPQGVDTPGVVLIQVHADLAHYWDGEDAGTLRL